MSDSHALAFFERRSVKQKDTVVDVILRTCTCLHVRYVRCACRHLHMPLPVLVPDSRYRMGALECQPVSPKNQPDIWLPAATPQDRCYRISGSLCSTLVGFRQEQQARKDEGWGGLVVFCFTQATAVANLALLWGCYELAADNMFVQRRYHKMAPSTACRSRMSHTSLQVGDQASLIPSHLWQQLRCVQHAKGAARPCAAKSITL